MKNADALLFQCEYGRFQKRYWWLFGSVGVIGLIGIPVGIFFNEGWKFSIHPVEPWAVTMIVEIISAGVLLLFGYVVLLSWMRGHSPQRVALTANSLIVPKGALSRQEIVLPLTEIKTVVFNLGFVKQLQIKHGRRKILLVSTMFPSDTDFDRLVSSLGM